MRNAFEFTNLVKDKTCFKTKNSTLLDVILTNRQNSFWNIVISETGLSDLDLTIFKSIFIMLPPKTIRYR